jgi:glycosyltransferase involved in cell wall biosynthesis
MKTKLLICLSYYSPNISGLSNYAKRLAESVSGQDLDVDVICVKHEDTLPAVETVSGVLVHRFKPSIKINKLLFSIPMLLWSITNIKKYNLVILNLPFPEAIFISLVSKLQKKKLISIFHCEVDLGLSTVKKLLSFLIKMASFITCLLSEKIVVNSMDYIRKISMFNFFTNKTVEIYPITGIKAYETDLKTRNSRKFRIGFLGRISKEKNLETLISAVNMFEKDIVELVIAGPTKVPGEGLYLDKVLCLTNNTRTRTHLVGELRGDKLGEFFGKIDFLALPSNSSTESFGIVQVEAMLSGVPVIVSNLPGIRIPVLETGAGVLVDNYNDAKAWYEALKYARKYKHELTKKTLQAGFIFNPLSEQNKWRQVIYEIQN